MYKVIKSTTKFEYFLIAKETVECGKRMKRKLVSRKHRILAITQASKGIFVIAIWWVW